MRNILSEKHITLKSADKLTNFIILDEVGQGGTCIAYKVTYEEADGIKHTGILKEYCPAYLENYGDVRNPDGSLRIPNEKFAQFADELQKFKDIYRAINEYLVANPEAANYHPVQLGLYEGNNTLYTLASCDYGKSYDKLKDKNLKSLLNLILSVTKGVEQYHNAGFLHLDIKPENIFILNEVTELVKLFDYDSLTAIDDIKSRKIKEIPCPGVYYVPELNQRNLRAIGISTDIYEIGAMLFLRLFGRSPEAQDRSYDAKYDFESAPLLKGVSPKVIFELETLFRYTLQTSVANRWQTTSELKHQLEKLISFVDTKKSYMLNMPKWQPSAEYVGRKDETSDIHRHLQTDGFVFIKGIGGLGKSELAKIYAKEYTEKYHTVVFCKYTDSLAGLVASLPVQGINTDDYSDFEKLVQDKNRILHECDSHTLIIVDNFNVTYDKFLRDFLPVGNDGFKVIFTTRCTQAAEYYANKTYDLPKLSFEDCERLFLHRAGLSADINSEDAIHQIIQTIDRNTLILVLLASAVKRTQMSLSEALAKLENQELDTIRPELFHEYDYDNEATEAYNRLLTHLYAVFSISALSSDEVEILKDMTLVDMGGILSSELVEFCKSPAVTQKSIDRLIAQSWLFTADNEVVSMHPTVSDLIANNKKLPKHQSYDNLAMALEEYCDPDYISHISVVLSRLSTALQLLRRYKTESLDKRIMINAKLGRLYANVYRPTEAKKYLIESEKLAAGSKHEYFLPYIYSFLGETEKDFSTLTSAIQYYQKSIQFGKKPTIRYYEIVAESMIDIGECYLENKQYDAAYKQFREALRFVRFHRYTDKIASIALPMIEICRELNLSAKEKKYHSLYEQYKKVDGYDEILDYQVFNQIEESGKAGNMSEMLRVYNEYLAQKKEELGEDSPLYKDIAQAKWMNYFISGEKESAIRAVTEDLTFVAESYGENSMEMAERLIVIAELFPNFNEFDYAETAAKRAIYICKKLHEENSYTYFQAMLSLAQCYIPQNRLNAARQAIADIDLGAFKGNEVLSDIISTAGFIFCELDMAEKIEPLCVEFLNNNGTDFLGKLHANLVLSVVNEHRGDLDIAERYAQEAKLVIDRMPDRKTARLYLLHYYRPTARLAYRRGDSKKAIAIIQELLSLHTEDEQMFFPFYVVFTELGLYYVCAGDMEAAEKAYQQAEKILTHNHMPKESYIGLYNNLAHQLITTLQFEGAKEYLDKIIEIQPDVLKPKTLVDAIICGNIAWTLFNLSKTNTDYALEINQMGLKCFEKNGAQNTAEYAVVVNNQALIYFETEQFKKAASAFEGLIEILDRNPMLMDVKTQALGYKLYVLSMLNIKKTKEAYAFAKKKAATLADRYGKNSIIYADFMMEIGAGFGAAYFEDCAEFYHIAQESLESVGHTETVSYAKLLNYIGVYIGEIKDKYNRSLPYFEQSKALFEKLGAQSEEAYPIVLENIKYAKDMKQKEMNKLISQLAKTIITNNDIEDESEDDE